MTNPFHPGPDDTFTVVGEGGEHVHPAAPSGERSFTPAIRHVHRAVRRVDPPRHLAVDEALGNAAAIAALLRAARGLRPRPNA
jgi:hypothetical protein